MPFDMTYPVRLLKGNLYQGTEESGGYDLYATEDAFVPIKGRVMISTGVFTEMNSDMVGVLRDRSGLAAKYGVTVLAGVIDADYDKEWKVVLLNSGNEPFKVNKGDRIAQVLFLKRYDVHCATEEATVTSGEKRVDGFGSTGK